MRIFKLFLFCSLVVWAEFKLDIPQDINVSQLEKIINNGWNESNKTLNDLIVLNAERILPEILEKIKEPFEKEKSTKENRFPIPKTNLRREDYWFIVSYTKYLESNNNIDKSLKLNIEILKGLRNIEDTSMLSVIYSLIIEGIVRDGLSQLIATHEDLKKQKSTEFKYLSNLFTVETSAFFTAMEGEKKFLSKAWDESAYQEFVVKKYSINYPNLMMDISRKIKKYNNLFYAKMFNAMKKETPEAMNIYEKEMNKMRKENQSHLNTIHFFISSLWIKVKSLIGMEIKDFGYVSEYLARNLVYVATPKIDGLYEEYLKHIQKNKLFLEKLKN